MSTINTSNSLGSPSIIPAGKRPSDPNANPLQAAHQNTLRTGSSDESHPGKTPSNPADRIRAATPSESVRNGPANRPTHTAEQRANALDTAQKLVSTTLIKPILSQARAARDAPAPWGQTQAEKQFGALLDNRIADDISKAAGFPIAQRIADQIIQNSPVDLDQLDALDQPITPLSPENYTPVDIFG